MSPIFEVGEMSSLETERSAILVVDDQPTNIRLLFEALRHTGYRTLAARSGEGAIEQAAVARPDLILLDVMMPGPESRDPPSPSVPRAPREGDPVIAHAVTQGVRVHAEELAGAARAVDLPSRELERAAYVPTHDRVEGWEDLPFLPGLLPGGGARPGAPEIEPERLPAADDHRSFDQVLEFPDVGQA